MIMPSQSPGWTLQAGSGLCAQTQRLLLQFTHTTLPHIRYIAFGPSPTWFGLCPDMSVLGKVADRLIQGRMPPPLVPVALRWSCWGFIILVLLWCARGQSRHWIHLGPLASLTQPLSFSLSFSLPCLFSARLPPSFSPPLPNLSV